jgi:tight adherence protein B
MDMLDAILVNGKITVIAILAIAAIAFVTLQPILSGENVLEGRIARFTKNPVIVPKRRGKLTPEQRRRQMIEEGLRQAATQGTRRTESIEMLLLQSGLEWNKRQFTTYGMALGMVMGIIVFTVFGGSVTGGYLGLAAMALSALLLPKRYVMFKRTKRFKAFNEELPNALDIITRGMRSGLHVNECIRTVAQETREPVKSEFGLICDSQSIGMTLPDAIQKMADRIPSPETNFLAIAVSLQSKNGGRLGEALDNLSKTLRQRKNMYAEIKALSMEAKASSVIIGIIPFAIVAMVSISTPDYIAPLFTTMMGKIGIAIALAWMFCGIFLIKTMSNIKV